MNLFRVPTYNNWLKRFRPSLTRNPEFNPSMQRKTRAHSIMWLRDEQSKVNVNWGGSSELRTLPCFYFEAFSFRRWNVAIVWPGLNSLMTRSSFSSRHLLTVSTVWIWCFIFRNDENERNELTVQETNVVPQFLNHWGCSVPTSTALWLLFVFALAPLKCYKNDSIGWFSVIYDTILWFSHDVTRRPCWCTQQIAGELSWCKRFFCFGGKARLLITWVKTLYSEDIIDITNYCH